MVGLVDKGHFKDIAKALDVAYQDVQDEFNLVWCIKGLIATRKHIMSTMKIWLKLNIISWFTLSHDLRFLPWWSHFTFQNMEHNNYTKSHKLRRSHKLSILA